MSWLKLELDNEADNKLSGARVFGNEAAMAGDKMLNMMGNTYEIFI